MSQSKPAISSSDFAVSQDMNGELVIQSQNQNFVAETQQADNAQHGKAGMPQLDVETFSSQIFWLIVTFAFLYLLLARSILPRIHDVLESRQNKISHDIDRAEQLRNEAEEARETYERALKESRAKAQDLIIESSALMEKSSTARHAELDKKIEQQMRDAEAAITNAKTEALAKLAPVSKELTQQIVEKLTGQSLKATEVDAVIDAMLKDKANA
ncbi:MAG: ATPase [Alphaproteobacteria bacterium]|nr:ATPase [Alphaproteobacteria bacterium]